MNRYKFQKPLVTGKLTKHVTQYKEQNKQVQLNQLDKNGKADNILNNRKIFNPSIKYVSSALQATGDIQIKEGYYYKDQPSEFLLYKTPVEIAQNSFSVKEYLKELELPTGILYILDNAFQNCINLQQITLPESVQKIGQNVFTNCTSLTEINIPQSVTSIGNYAFKDCISLTDVIFPDSITNVGDGVFLNCSNLNHPVYNKHCFAYLPTSYSGAYTVQDGITYIASEAFRNCSSVTEVTIPKSVTTTGSHIFDGCSTLTTVTINGDTNIGDYAFYHCYALATINAPEGIVNVGSYMFTRCEALTSVTIKPGVTSIGEGAFWACFSLTSITIPDSVTSIGRRAFAQCDALSTITIPDKVTQIGPSSFTQCDMLTSITIGKNVINIGQEALHGANLQTIICKPTNPPTLNSWNQVDTIKDIYVPRGSVDSYKKATNWSYYGNKIKDLMNLECTSLSITANDVIGNKTQTQVQYQAVVNGYDVFGNYIENVNINGTAISNEFEQNLSTTDPIEREVTFEYCGVTATTTITQGVWLDQYYEVDLNNRWRLSSTYNNPDPSTYDGIYESFSNYNVHNSSADMYIDLVGYQNFNIYVACSAHAGDKIVVTEPNSTTYKQTINGYSPSPDQIGSYKLVQYTDLPETCRISIRYIKDKSTNQRQDRGFIIIPKQ